MSPEVFKLVTPKGSERAQLEERTVLKPEGAKGWSSINEAQAAADFLVEQGLIEQYDYGIIPVRGKKVTGIEFDPSTPIIADIDRKSLKTKE